MSLIWTQITEIPKELVNLKELYCSWTDIKEIPKELVNLEELYYSCSKITEIPKEINLKHSQNDTKNVWIFEM